MNGRAVFDMADRIKEEHTSAAEDMLEAANYEIGPLADLLRGALSEVNWHEIAKHWIEAAKQEVDRRRSDAYCGRRCDQPASRLD